MQQRWQSNLFNLVRHHVHFPVPARLPPPVNSTTISSRTINDITVGNAINTTTAVTAAIISGRQRDCKKQWIF